MSRAADQRALADRIVEFLRSSDGFPVSAGDVAKVAGEVFSAYWRRGEDYERRPDCWPKDLRPTHVHGDYHYCARCRTYHIAPVWRSLQADEIRPVLNALAAEGRVEKIVLDGAKRHYWRYVDASVGVS